MPSKPDKYGVKLCLLCDCPISYIFNGFIKEIKKTLARSAYIVKLHFKSLHFFGVSTTTDSCFASSQLAFDLLQKQIILLYSMRKKHTISS